MKEAKEAYTKALCTCIRRACTHSLRPSPHARALMSTKYEKEKKRERDDNEKMAMFMGINYLF